LDQSVENDVRALHIDVGEVLGSTLVLRTIETRPHSFAVGYTLLGHWAEVEGSATLNPLARLHGLWEAVDNLGREYVGIGDTSEATRTEWAGVIRFIPGLTEGAVVLSLVARDAETDFFRYDVPLEHRLSP
jgi:hypothetical protein